jgi:hypothetical protein
MIMNCCLARASSVSSAGGGERTLDHDRVLAWPVPFAFLTGSDESARKEIAGSFRPRWCLKHTNPDRTKRVPKETCRNEDPANRLAAGVAGRA